MKHHVPNLCIVLFLVACLYACKLGPTVREGGNKPAIREEENERYDGAGLAMKFEFDKTKDPVTGRVEREKLWPVIEYTYQLKQDLRSQMSYSKATTLGWVERGPNSDTVGGSNGNTRPNNGIASGRIRSAMVDAGDVSGNTVFVGGIDGGLWKTTSITSTPAGWVNINDKFANLAITSICQDPKRPDTIYFATGEPNFNSDGVQGDGIFRSLDGGANWTQLSSTTSVSSGGVFNYCSKILCDTLGNVYVGTRSGLRRSTNQGTSWTDITPSSTGTTPYIGDIVISSTGRLHVTVGLTFTSTAYYRYTDIPATVTSSGWTSAATPMATANIDRIVLACKGNALIALPSDVSTDDVGTIYESSDGGANWSGLSNTPSFTSGQGWYCLAADINPANNSQYIVGSLDCYRSTNGGSSWSHRTNWVGSTLSYLHADQHQAIWYTAGAQSRIIVVSDGGVFLSTDGGGTFTDRNVGLRIRQYYSCAIHPSTTNYVLGGAQDNGTNQLNTAGLAGCVEVTGGDGATVHIDQNQPQYQFGSYVFNEYRVSTNSGSTWSSANLSSTSGQFINPTDYDNTANIMYCGDVAGSYRRWTNPQTGSTSAVVSITALNSSDVLAISVSPFTANRVYFGTAAGRVVRVDNANTVATGSAGTLLGTLTANVANIAFGGTEDTIIVTASTYSGTQVYYTTNGTNASPTWVSKDGNLPNMPVRWALFTPNTGSKGVILATETGIWTTTDITAGSVSWLADPTFPTVRTDMLKLRSSDGKIVAATHGRGMWTASVQTPLALSDFLLKGTASANNIALSWGYQTAREAVKFDVERSANGRDFVTVFTQKASVGSKVYDYSEARLSSSHLYYRIKSYDVQGLTQYSNTVGFPGGTASAVRIITYPNPFSRDIFVSVTSPAAASMKLQVYSVSGAKVFDSGIQQMPAGSQVLPLDLTNLSTGNYVVVATIDEKKYWSVIVKR